MRSLIPAHAARTIARRTMPLTCVIKTPINRNSGTYNRVTGVTGFAEQAVIYEGPCAFEPTQAGRVSEHQGGPASIETMLVTIPIGQTGIRPGQELKITSGDDDALSAEYEVVRVTTRSHRMSRTVEVQRVQQIPTPGVSA